jgi:succinoglycan biosynthesis transport protein ExoP
MNFGQFFSILRARWMVAAFVFGLTIATTLVVSLLLPKSYTAVASVVLDVKPDPLSAVMYQGAANPSFMATQVDVIRSDRVARRVVQNLKLTENPQIRDQWTTETRGQGDIVQWLSDSFQKNMEVVPSRESNVIMISYKAPEPRFAAGLANAFVQAYLQTALDLRVEPARQYATFFEERVKEAGGRLESAQAKMSAFQKEKGIVATDERLDIENARLSELSSQLVGLQALASDSTSRQAQVAGSAEGMQEVLQNSVISNIKSDLSRSEARLQELSARLGDKHPQVLESKASITEMRARMDAEVKRVTGGVGVTSAINRQRVAELRNALDAQRDKVLRMKEVRDEGAVLVRDVESAQRAYDQILARQSQTSLESQATQSNISILTQASPPLEPSSPKILLNTLLAVFVGGLLAMGLALVLELLDRRVRSVEDVTSSLGLPVLGVLPKQGSKSRFGKHAALSMRQRLLTGNGGAAAKGA